MLGLKTVYEHTAVHIFSCMSLYVKTACFVKWIFYIFLHVKKVWNVYSQFLLIFMISLDHLPSIMNWFRDVTFFIYPKNHKKWEPNSVLSQKYSTFLLFFKFIIKYVLFYFFVLIHKSYYQHKLYEFLGYLI